MSDTVIDTKINGTFTSKPFTSNVGTPQGDSLITDLFTVYLEHALKEVQPTLTRPITSFESEAPTYADDVDFVGQNYADIKKFQEVLKNTSLKSTRTRQYTSISRRMERSKKVR